jgi:hypothetical protein
MATRKPEMSDIRLNGRHRIIAAPEWAFELEKRRYFSRRAPDYELRAEWKPVWDKLTSLRRSAARDARPGLRHPTQRAVKICVVCYKSFFGIGNVSACTDQCAKERRHSTRTRGTKRRRPVYHDLRPCKHCGEPFKPRRADAVYCSPRCRVADHRNSRVRGV